MSNTSLTSVIVISNFLSDGALMLHWRRMVYPNVLQQTIILAHGNVSEYILENSEVSMDAHAFDVH